MSHQKLEKYEIGSNRVSASVLDVMARAFSVPLDDLFEGVDVTTGLDEAKKHSNSRETNATLSWTALHP